MRHTKHAYAAIVIAVAIAIGERSGTAQIITTPPVITLPTINRGAWNFGFRCQADFDPGWSPQLPTVNSYALCMSAMHQVNTRGYDVVNFYYDLKNNAKLDIEDHSGSDSADGGPDAVQFFFLTTHGSRGGAYAMFDAKTNAFSTRMRIGDSGIGGGGSLVFASYSCDTMHDEDGTQLNRWQNAFNGGLKVALGAYDIVYDGNTQKGTELVDRLEDGEPVSESWNDAVWYADNDNHPIALATGRDQTECMARLNQSVTQLNFSGIEQDGTWQVLCGSRWHDQ